MDITTTVFGLLLVLMADTADGAIKKPPRAIEKTGQDELVHQLIDKPGVYTKQDPPRLDKPTLVQLGMYVNSFYSISEQSMDYNINFYLRQSWDDPRLAFAHLNSRYSAIKLEDRMWEKIWVPDTFFRNEKRASFHDITVPNRLLRLHSNGTVWYVSKISATFSCPMKLQKYPLDTQRCPLMFESFGYTMDRMYFGWLPDPTVTVDENLQLPQFTLRRHELKDCSQSYTAGNYTCAEVNFVLSRDIGFFLIQVYVPSVLIVILSWVSFWINIESSPARVSIGLLTVLTTTTMSAGARASLPRVSYIKAIDVWMIICLIFVFTSLIEYAVVNVMARRLARPRKPRSSAPVNQEPEPKRSICICFKKKAAGGPDQPAKPSDVEAKRQASNIDKISRQLFPIAFILFNIVYWIAYAVPSNED